MGKSLLTSFATAASAGLALGFVQASAASLPLSGGGSALFSDSDSETTRERASSALENMMDRFIRIEAEQTAAAAADAEDECPEEKKKTRIAESEKDEKSDKETPQGPEPIYFAF